MKYKFNSYLKLRFYDWDGFRYVRTLIREYFQQFIPRHSKLMEVAINEAVNNALKYGRTTKGISLTLGVRNNEVVAEVRDYSAGFDFQEHLKQAGREEFPEMVLDDDCGRGIFLMRAAADKLSYNKRGNRVRMTKKMPGSSDVTG